MTKKQKSMIDSYKWAVNKGLNNIWKAYGRPSEKKVRAFNNCEADKKMYGGYDAFITGASSHFFSYAFKYRDEKGTERMRYHTYANVYDFAIDE